MTQNDEIYQFCEDYVFALNVTNNDYEMGMLTAEERDRQIADALAFRDYQIKSLAELRRALSWYIDLDGKIKRQSVLTGEELERAIEENMILAEEKYENLLSGI